MNAIHTDEQLDHYRIDKLIARSGMASIYRATDTRNNRPVAIKVPHPEMESDPVLHRRRPQPHVHGDGVGRWAPAEADPQ